MSDCLWRSWKQEEVNSDLRISYWQYKNNNNNKGYLSDTGQVRKGKEFFMEGGNSSNGNIHRVMKIVQQRLRRETEARDRGRSHLLPAAGWRHQPRGKLEAEDREDSSRLGTSALMADSAWRALSPRELLGYKMKSPDSHASKHCPWNPPPIQTWAN